MDNLPTWAGASVAYSRAYRNLARLCASEARGRKPGRYVPSQEVRDYTDALDKGDENDIKAYNLRYLVAE